MNKLILLTICALTAAWPLAAQDKPSQAGKGHPFVCTDYTQGKVFVVSAEGEATWEYPAKDCNDVWVLPNGNFLFNTGRGVVEVTRDKRIHFKLNFPHPLRAAVRAIVVP